MIPGIGSKYSFGQSGYSGLDGKIRYVAVRNGYIKKSTDHGVTWTDLTAFGSRDWSAIATDYSGSIIVAGINSSTLLFKSINGGVDVSAVSVFSSTTNCINIAMSYDGHYMFVVGHVGDDFNYPRRSSDYGDTWVQITADPYASGICCSKDGSIVYLSGKNTGTNSIYKSTNYGASWSWIYYINSGYSSISCSEDGSVVVCICYNTSSYISYDSGTTWSSIPVIGMDVSVNYNGTIILTASRRYLNGHYGLEYSVDSGANWIQIQNTTTRCENVAINRQGNCMIAGPNNGTKFYYATGDIEVAVTYTIPYSSFTPIAINRSLTD
jgi:photosystem II stability/assembly factor-like uncharacterized protein